MDRNSQNHVKHNKVSMGIALLLICISYTVILTACSFFVSEDSYNTERNKDGVIEDNTIFDEKKSFLEKKTKKKQSKKSIIYKSKYSEQAKDIIDNIISYDMTDVEKVKAVHDYIVVNTEYDTVGLENDNLPDHAFTVEGVLIKGIAVCQGYADTFQLFMDLLNIESQVVLGTDLVNGVGHAWNMVCLDDKWYQIDVTWDDPVPDQGDNVNYKYFLMTDDILDDDHKWIKADYPKCDSQDYLYYIYKDYIVSSKYDVEAKFMEQYHSGLRQITLLYPEEGMPDFTFFYVYDYLWKDADGESKINYTYSPIWRLGDYSVLTLVLE